MSAPPCSEYVSCHYPAVVIPAVGIIPYVPISAVGTESARRQGEGASHRPVSTDDLENEATQGVQVRAWHLGQRFVFRTRPPAV